MEELTGLNRRYAHLHTPKHLTNPDHLSYHALPDTMTDEQIRRRLENKYAHRRVGRQIWQREQHRVMPPSANPGAPGLQIAARYSAGKKVTPSPR